ncbi:OsmC family protein [Nocardia speluncae]|uniref:OsmC family protein n=1 Tax=Nocardia speluncae TaxID=419477 RepID=A0A846XB44_9NOCA|nr:OsmC family protein [Nocardia speluncae]NKY33162.1 OsmC family protein [Nocardia speluncae]
MPLADTVRRLHAAIRGRGDGRQPFAARARWHPETTTRVGVRFDGHTMTVDEPAAAGGTDSGPNPIELALAALGSCQIITYRFQAARLGIAVTAIEAEVRAHLDMSPVFGLTDLARYPEAIRIRIRVEGPATAADYRELQRLVDDSCPVLAIAHGRVPVHSELEVGS